MGWKLSSILIKPTPATSHADILRLLMVDPYEAAGSEVFHEAILPQQDKIFLGVHRGCLLILSEDLPFHFYQPQLSPLERRLIAANPGAEIFAASLQSTVNHWGYAIIERGEKIRFRTGDADNDTIEYGKVQKEEEGLFSQSTIDDHGQRVYELDGQPDELFTDDQLGEEFVFDFFIRYTGERFDLDTDIFELEMSEYHRVKAARRPATLPPSRPWWSFW